MTSLAAVPGRRRPFLRLVSGHSHRCGLAQVCHGRTAEVDGVAKRGAAGAHAVVVTGRVRTRYAAVNRPSLVACGNCCLRFRTDTGVHALCSSGHFDLLHPRHEDGAKYQPKFIANGLNRYFDKARAEIRSVGHPCICLILVSVCFEIQITLFGVIKCALVLRPMRPVFFFMYNCHVHNVFCHCCFNVYTF